MLRYNPDSTIEYNLSYEEEKWENYTREINLTNKTPSQTNTAPLKISSAKYANQKDNH